jgi:hypothetical protein
VRSSRQAKLPGQFRFPNWKDHILKLKGGSYLIESLVMLTINALAQAREVLKTFSRARGKKNALPTEPFLVSWRVSPKTEKLHFFFSVSLFAPPLALLVLVVIAYTCTVYNIKISLFVNKIK